MQSSTSQTRSSSRKPTQSIRFGSLRRLLGRARYPAPPPDPERQGFRGDEHDTTWDDDVSLDTVLGLLSNKRRRRCIELLAEQPGITKQALITQITAEEHEDGDVERSMADAEKRVYVAVHQHHLPLLREHGIVTQDDDNRLYPTKRTAHFVEILDSIRTVTG